MNNKGFSGVVAYAFLGFAVVVAALGTVLQPSHVARRAVEKCVEVGGGTQEQCEVAVAGMTHDQRKEVIRDKLVGDCTTNFDNGVCGD